MFIGHFGISMGAKKITPRVSLGSLVMASIFLDLLWPVFLLLGWEKVRIAPGITQMTPFDFSYYPWSHSLLMACVWGFLFGGIYYLLKRNRKGALTLALVVVSHWVLDFLVHRPDLPLYPGNSPVVGLGLWNHTWVELLIESIIFLGGMLLYLQSTTAKNRKGKYGFWGLILFLMLIFISNIAGPPPSDVTSLAWMGLSQWLLVIWAFWIDRNRLAKTSASPAGIKLA